MSTGASMIFEAEKFLESLEATKILLESKIRDKELLINSGSLKKINKDAESAVMKDIDTLKKKITYIEKAIALQKANIKHIAESRKILSDPVVYQELNRIRNEAKSKNNAQDIQETEQKVEAEQNTQSSENIEPETNIEDKNTEDDNKINQGENNENIEENRERRPRTEDRGEQTGDSKIETENQERQTENEGNGSRSETISSTGEKDSRETSEAVETKEVAESENEQDGIKFSISINRDKWTKYSPKQNPNTAYVFTENINSIGSNRVGGGSAVIRNNPNAIGIVTKKYYVYSEDRATSDIKGGWNQDFKDTEADFELFKKTNLEQFKKLDKFDSIIFPDSFANSLASIPNRFAVWLQNELRTRYGLITELNSKGTGLISKSVNQPQFNIVNSGNYSSNDVIFVSIGGKRGNETVRKQQQDKTIKEAIKALEAGATLITDNTAYVESNSYNEGEKRLAANLKAKGYNYSEITVDGDLLGVWSKNNNISKILSDTNNKIPYEIASEFLKLQNINISKEVWDKYLPIRQHDLISRLRKSNPNCE